MNAFGNFSQRCANCAPMDNETMIISDYPIARFYTNGIFAGTLILTGITANILVIASWLCDRGRWLPLYYYFLAFASWNLVLLISTFFFYSLPAILRQPADHSTIAWVPYFYVVGYAGANCSLTAVVWLMVVLTIERFVAVSRPFHTRISSPRRRAKLISATISLGAILYNIPLTFELSIIGMRYEIRTHAIDPTSDQWSNHADRWSNQAPDQWPNKASEQWSNHASDQWPDHIDHLSNQAPDQSTRASFLYIWMVDTAPFRSDFYYQTLYRVVAHLIFISLVPFIIISTLTMKIVSMVQRTNSERVFYRRAMAPVGGHRSSGLRGGADGGSRRNAAVPSSLAAATYGNVLLTVFVVKFLLCYTLPFALNVLELILPEHVFRADELMWLTDASDLLVILDSVSNAFLYFSWRRRIRFYKKKRSTCKEQGLMSECASLGHSPRPTRTWSRRLPLRMQTKTDGHYRELVTLYPHTLRVTSFKS